MQLAQDAVHLDQILDVVLLIEPLLRYLHLAMPVLKSFTAALAFATASATEWFEAGNEHIRPVTGTELLSFLDFGPN